MKLADRHIVFEELHQAGTFVMPNPWDIGSARMMAGLGAKSLATTSSGFAFTIGRSDMGTMSRDEALSHAQEIIGATDLPVSGDFENGFADDPEGVGETIRLAGEIGLSGCCIEDTQMVDGNPAYDFDLAVERIKAAVSASRALGRPFVLCARADGIMNGSYEIDEAVKRCQAFEDAGADLLYAPALGTVEDLKKLVSSVIKPVNALARGELLKLSVQQFEDIGVRRISLGSMVAKLTQAAIQKSVSAMLNEGEFKLLEDAALSKQIDQLLLAGSGSGEKV